MVVIIILIILLLFAGFVVYKFRHDSNNNSIGDIYNCMTVDEVVSTITHGAVRPYCTRMNLGQVLNIIKRHGGDDEEIKGMMFTYELMGVAPSIELPNIISPVIEDVFIRFNKNKVVSSITIYTKDINKARLMFLMQHKLGKPTSMSSEFVIWKLGCMVIHIYLEDGSIMVFDERL